MNTAASNKQNFIKYDNAQQLFKELYNVCLLFKNTEHYYYCYCKETRSQKIKCTLCKFDDAFDNKGHEKFLITHRNDVENYKKFLICIGILFNKLRRKIHQLLIFLIRSTFGLIAIIATA